MCAQLSQVIVKLVSPCNLNCSYCYVYNHEDKGFRSRPKTMSDDTFDAVLARINEYCACHGSGTFNVGFHGGEPTLIGLPRFETLVHRAKRVLKNNLGVLSLQTNATLLDKEWARALRDLGVAPNVSLDGPAPVHDATRITHAGDGSHGATVRGLKHLQDVGFSPMVFCVVNPRHSGEEVYTYLRSLGITVMDFLMPDVTHDSYSRFYEDLGPTRVGAYLVEVLDAWLGEDDPDVSIRIFRDLFRRLLGGSGVTDAFGNTGSSYLIVETDGSLEANDALRVCEHGMARTGLNVVANGLQDIERALPPAHRAIHGGFALPGSCTTCPEKSVCGGGYLPHRYSKRDGFDNPSVWCADILFLLSHMREYLVADQC